MIEMYITSSNNLHDLFRAIEELQKQLVHETIYCKWCVQKSAIYMKFSKTMYSDILTLVCNFSTHIDSSVTYTSILIYNNRVTNVRAGQLYHGKYLLYDCIGTIKRSVLRVLCEQFTAPRLINWIEASYYIKD